MNACYQPPNEAYWRGRASDQKEYWHQSINLIDLAKTTEIYTDFAIIGYQCDEGVRRNQGRVGAKKGPDSIRNVLGKLPIHKPDISLADCGDLVFDEGLELYDFQLQFAECVNLLIRNKTFPIALGGGHDISYAHFCGIHNALYQEGKQFGIVNFDAHFDLRKEVHSTSGTPFNQIQEQFGDHTHYTVFGIQQSSNTKELFEIAEQTNANYLPLETCSLSNINESIDFVDKLEAKVDYLYITIDMDCFSSAYSPGVSAPSPFGLTPDYVLQMLKYILTSKKVVAIDFAETNPTYDIDNSTSRLAAKLIWEVVQNS